MMNTPSFIVTTIPTLGLLLCGPAMAQPDSPRLQLGVLLPVVSLSEHQGMDVGIGGRLTYDLTNHFALEGELNLFPLELTRTTRAPGVPMTTDQRLQALIGVKAGAHWEHLGIFAKFRPGFVAFQNKLHVVCITAPCPPLSSSQTEMALDLGAGLEFYLSRRVALRIDLSDLWIGGTGNDMLRNDGIGATGDLGHNFLWTTGVGIRF